MRKREKEREKENRWTYGERPLGAFASATASLQRGYAALHCGPGSSSSASWENRQFLMARVSKGLNTTTRSAGRPAGRPSPFVSMRRAFRSALIYLSIVSPISLFIARPHRLLLSLGRIRLWSLVAAAAASPRPIRPRRSTL